MNIIANTNSISSWKSKGLSAESIKPPTTSDNTLTPKLNYFGNKVRVKFTGSYLKQPKISYTHEKVVNIYIVYGLGASTSHDNDPTLKNCLFGVVNKKNQTLINLEDQNQIEDQIFHFQVVDSVKMYQFYE